MTLEPSPLQPCSNLFKVATDMFSNWLHKTVVCDNAIIILYNFHTDENFPYSTFIRLWLLRIHFGNRHYFRAHTAYSMIHQDLSCMMLKEILSRYPVG